VSSAQTPQRTYTLDPLAGVTAEVDEYLNIRMAIPEEAS
jgi:hypothetical protein